MEFPPDVTAIILSAVPTPSLSHIRAVRCAWAGELLLRSASDSALDAVDKAKEAIARLRKAAARITEESEGVN